MLATAVFCCVWNDTFPAPASSITPPSHTHTTHTHTLPPTHTLNPTLVLLVWSHCARTRPQAQPSSQGTFSEQWMEKQYRWVCTNKLEREFSDTNFEIGKPCDIRLNGSGLSPWSTQSKCRQGVLISDLVSQNSLFRYAGANWEATTTNKLLSYKSHIHKVHSVIGNSVRFFQ